MSGDFGGFEGRTSAGPGLEFVKLGGQGREQFLFGIEHFVILGGTEGAPDDLSQVVRAWPASRMQP